MNIHDLIKELQELEEEYPEADVRMACQPNWPFEYSIDSVIAVDTNNDNKDELEEREEVDFVIYL